jgi:outer membrane receptor protein involved in Fe transport
VTYEQAGWMGAIEGVFYADQGDVAGYNNELKTKGYMLLNLRGKYEPYHGVVIGTGIENVIDSKHYDHLGGYANHNRNNGRVAMPGRNIYATLSYNW